MRKERVTHYITERQKQQLEKRAQAEDLPMAEIIRRALDAYLAWDDPTYAPHPTTQKERRSPSHPSVTRASLLTPETKGSSPHE